MNINLNPTKETNRLGLGLNKRGTGGHKQTRKNVLEEDEENSVSSQLEDTDQKVLFSRSTVNEAILNEQTALRKRAQVAAISAAEDIYDYDKAYDSFRPLNDDKKSSTKEKNSRYIHDLLNAAGQRKREREVVLERKIARELRAEEEADVDVQGKEKFITAAYKQKLQERKVWQEEEEKKQKIDDENDVTKRTGDGGAMASFYGNFNKNVALGRGNRSNQKENESIQCDDTAEQIVAESRDAHGTVLESTEKSDNLSNESIFKSSRPLTDTPQIDVMNKLQMRQIRDEKIKQAKIRYFQRHRLNESNEVLNTEAKIMPKE